VIQTIFDLAPGQSVSLLFLEGECANRNEADALIQRYSTASTPMQLSMLFRSFGEKH
jgi:hypothetical protein